jgi:hypothetical protein
MLLLLLFPILTRRPKKNEMHDGRSIGVGSFDVGKQASERAAARWDGRI